MVIPVGTYTYAYNSIGAQLTGIIVRDNGTLTYTYDGFLPKTSTLAGDVTGSVDRTYDNDFRSASRSVNGGNT